MIIEIYRDRGKYMMTEIKHKEISSFFLNYLNSIRYYNGFFFLYAKTSK